MGGIHVALANEEKINSNDCFAKRINDDSNGSEKYENGNDEEGDDDGETHNAGKNCLTSGCHISGENKFYIAGTIYTDPYGTAPRVSAKIKIEDVDGDNATLKSDQQGNFYTSRNMSAPFNVSATYAGREVFMPTAAPQGGCNADGCHNGITVGRVFISTEDLDLAGTVTDADTSDPVYGATVSLSKKKNKKDKIKYSATTDINGEFILQKVKAGKYTLTVSKTGYETYSQTYIMTQTNVVPLEITLNKP